LKSLCGFCKSYFLPENSKKNKIKKIDLNKIDDSWSVSLDETEKVPEQKLKSILSSKEMVNFEQNAKSTKFKYFDKSYNLMLKLLGDEPLEERDTDISYMEKQLVREFLFKKKMFKRFDIKNFNHTKLQKLRLKEKSRRTEEHLKFIFKKCINHLQNEFRTKMKNKLELDNDLKKLMKDSEQFDYYFYNHYFGQIASQINEPIEKFFHFRNWKNRTNTNIPKSITKSYIQRIKMNTDFISRFLAYLNNELLNEIILGNEIKISKIVNEWEQGLRKHGLTEGPEIVLNEFQAKKMNLPWGISEIKKAIKNTKDYIMLVDK
jgi:hypothetical protein